MNNDADAKTCLNIIMPNFSVQVFYERDSLLSRALK